MIKSISGTTASIGAWLFALSSTEPPTATEYPAGSRFANSATCGASWSTTVFGCTSSRVLALQRDRGKPRPSPYGRLLYFVAQGGDGTERHRLAAQANKLQIPQRVD